MFKIPKSVYESMLRLAIQESPVEACGYLAGNDNEVSMLIPMTNVDQSSEHFSFAPEEQFQALKTARSEELKFLAVFHSHPASPARMSAEDIRLANDPEIVYVILSLLKTEPKIRGFQVVSKTITEVTIEIVEGASR